MYWTQQNIYAMKNIVMEAKMVSLFIVIAITLTNMEAE